MKTLILHPQTRQQLEQFSAAPSHALMLVGPSGSGKKTVAMRLAEQILGLSDGAFTEHPYTSVVAPEEPGKAIGIEAVRQLEQFLALKVPGQASFDRAIIIEDAHLLTTEAQNALLKTLEEPPEGTILILTVNYLQSVLPTIRSRAQSVTLGHLDKATLAAHFTPDFDDKLINQAYAISGGLPGLMHALLYETENPLMQATEKARQLLSQTTYERLLSVDELAKNRLLATDVTTILQQMAHVSLQSAQGPAAKKWETVLRTSYDTNEALANSAQPKLALDHLMLSL